MLKHNLKFGNLKGNLDKTTLIDLGENVLRKLATIAALSAIDKFESKVSRTGAVRAHDSLHLLQMKIWIIFSKL